MWELVAREHIRDTLARYNWSGDAGRLDELADTFSPDGALEIRAFEPLRGIRDRGFPRRCRGERRRQR